MKYFLLTLGCQMNFAESEKLEEFLEKKGFRSVSREKEADLILANLCSVRQSAVDRIYGKLKNWQKLKEKNPSLKIGLFGCLLKEDKKKLKEKVDFIFNLDQTSNLNFLDNLKKSHLPSKNPKPKRFSSIKYVPIMTGCNSFCSYCVVPYTRGQEISRPAEEILKEIKDLVKKGYKEIVLLGQNVNRYLSRSKAQKNKSTSLINFSKLLKIISEIPGNFKISFLTSHPRDFSDELIEIIAQCEKVKKEIHLPVQSGDNQILKKMNRKYSREEYIALIKKIRRKIPQVKISTDIIVGFPGETKKQFENTLKLCQEIKFDKAYINKYSSRQGTAAAKLEDNVPVIEKKRRWEILEKLINS